MTCKHTQAGGKHTQAGASDQLKLNETQCGYMEKDHWQKEDNGRRENPSKDKYKEQYRVQTHN